MASLKGIKPFVFLPLPNPAFPLFFHWCSITYPPESTDLYSLIDE